MDLSAFWVRILLAGVVLLGAIALAVLVFSSRAPVTQQVIRSSTIDTTVAVANIVLAIMAIGALIVSIAAYVVSKQSYAIETQPVLMLACKVGESSKPPPGWTHVISPMGTAAENQVVQMFGQESLGEANVGHSNYQCTLYNYGRLPALNVKLSFQIAFRKDNNPASAAAIYNLDVPTNRLESEINVPTGGSFTFSFINSGKLNVFITPNPQASIAKIGSQDRQDVTLNFGQFTFAANFLPHGAPLQTKP